MHEFEYELEVVNAHLHIKWLSGCILHKVSWLRLHLLRLQQGPYVQIAFPNKKIIIVDDHLQKSWKAAFLHARRPARLQPSNRAAPPPVQGRSTPQRPVAAALHTCKGPKTYLFLIENYIYECLHQQPCHDIDEGLNTLCLNFSQHLALAGGAGMNTEHRTHDW